jgi:hypothetical protein
MAKSGIHIKPSRQGLLRKKMGVKGKQKISSGDLAAKKRQAKRTGNTKLMRQVVFAQNARRWKH